MGVVEEDVVVCVGVELFYFGFSSIRFYFYLLNEGIFRVRSYKILSCIDWVVFDGICIVSVSFFFVLLRKGGMGRSSKFYLCVMSRVVCFWVFY